MDFFFSVLYFGFINKLFSNLIITLDKEIKFRTSRRIYLFVRWSSSFIFWTRTVLQYVTCYQKMSIKSPVCIQRYSLLNMSQNNTKQRTINTKYRFLLVKTRSYTHILYIILKFTLQIIWIGNNFEEQVLLLYAHFVITGHIYGFSQPFQD